jgi:hypothetical protein
MTIEYHLDENDLLVHQLFIASQSARIKKKRSISRAIIPIAFVIVGIYYLTNADIVGLVVFVLFALLWYFFYPDWEKGHYSRHYRAFIKENFKNMIGVTTTLELNNDYILAVCNGSESKILTTQLEQIDEIPETIFVKLKTGHSFVFPKDKIENVDLLKDRLKDLATHLNVRYVVHDKWEWK